MTTQAIQWVFDNAAAISINKRAIVAQTVSRDQTVRTTSRGGQIWRFDVTMPAALSWDQARPYIAGLEKLDKHTSGTVSVNSSGYTSWMNKYQGDSASTVGFTASWTTGNTITLTAYPGSHGLTNGEITLKAGDWLQLGTTGGVYEVTTDVVYPATTVNLHRPLIDSASNGSIRLSSLCEWPVVCVQFPNWTITDINLVSFDGPFRFFEVMT